MKARPKVLDLFCGAGGAAMGYHRAGYDVIGMDVVAQPNYPFEFVQVDVFDPTATNAVGEYTAYDLEVDVIHASPPCQLHSTQRTGVTREYRDLIEPTRDLVSAMAEVGGGGRRPLPYVIENVVGAPLRDPIMLCGTSLGCIDGDTDLQRHRLFESNRMLWNPPACAHSAKRRTLGVYGDMADHDRPNRPISERNPSHRGWKAGRARARRLMGVDWPMTDRELAEAIPPAFTEWIGRQLLEVL